MRLLVLVLFLSAGYFAYSQDFRDYRNNKESFARMQEKDIRFDLASFTMGGVNESIGKLPLTGIPPTAFSDEHITFEGENVKVTITAGRFQPSKHKLTYDDKYLVKINGKPYHGVYGEIPQESISSLTVTINGDSVVIPPAAYADIFNPQFGYRDGTKMRTFNKVLFSPDKKKIYIYMLNKNGKDSYEVTWVIQDKQYLRRVIDYGFM